MNKDVQGTQVVGRVAKVLTAISASTDQAPRTADVAARTGLSRPTVHRLLTSLRDLGFVDRDEASARWHLGPEMYILGTAAARRYGVSPAARKTVFELARATGETAFLSVRRDREIVFLRRVEGNFPLRSMALREGMRLPLGVSAGGVALLAYQNDEFIETYLAEFGLDWGPNNSPEAIRNRVAEARVLGYALNPGLDIQGNFGMAAAVVQTGKPTQFALTITGVESRFRKARQSELGSTLLTFAHRLAQFPVYSLADVPGRNANSP